MSREEVKAYWTGVRVGVERYAYWWSQPGVGPGTYRKCVGPEGTTTLAQALQLIEHEEKEALNGLDKARTVSGEN